MFFIADFLLDKLATFEFCENDVKVLDNGTYFELLLFYINANYLFY